MRIGQGYDVHRLTEAVSLFWEAWRYLMKRGF